MLSAQPIANFLFGASFILMGRKEHFPAWLIIRVLSHDDRHVPSKGLILSCARVAQPHCHTPGE
jgi:hypothetical protein